MPRRIKISPMPFLTEIFGKGLIKDLNDTEEYTEEICQHCGGTGVGIQDNPYGLKEENRKDGIFFPYKVQTISSCPHCGGTGVVKRCRNCGELLPVYRLKCSCAQQQAKDKAEKQRKWKEKIDSLRVASPEEVDENRCFYSEAFPYNEGYFADFHEFFDAWEEGDPGRERPEYCFGTDKIEFHIDADQIVENACEDLYEEAYENVSNIDALQKSIDKWAKKNGPGSTYVYHTRYKVRIPWEEAES